MGSNEPECEQSISAKSTLSVDLSLKNGGQLSLALPISELSMGSLVISSAADSLAKTPLSHVLPKGNASELEAQEQGCGKKSNVWPLIYDHDTSSWKTCQVSLVPGLELFSETWPRSGTMQNGVAYQHPRPVSRTSGIGCGLWPTPTSRDYRDISTKGPYLSQLKRRCPSTATRLQANGIHWSAISRIYEMMMGYQLDYTKNGLKPSAIPSSQ